MLINSAAVNKYSLNSILKSSTSSFVFLETASFDAENKQSFLFNSFCDFLTFYPQDDVDVFLKKMEDYIKAGFWLAGFFCYEFGYFLDEALYSLRPRDESRPLVWLGVCRKPFIFNHKITAAGGNSLSYTVSDLKPGISEKEYKASIARIKKYIEQGKTYQVNFTFKYKFNFRGDVLNFYIDLRRAQPTPYMSLINTGTEYILSLSPELFFRLRNGRIETKPMKGTVSCGYSLVEDEERKNWLKNDVKNRAENIMIVDLLRNDLGKISETGSVEVLNLFKVEKYRTLHQMTSEVKSCLKKDCSLKEIICALFPSGSVTGAPKINTMKIIAELEKEPRNIYTGAIGYISPEHNACFNVAIRTVSIKNGRAELGVGGGIVYDSDNHLEFKEANLKADFLIKKFPFFSLIESVRWENGNSYYLLDLHLKRLISSAKFFEIPLDLKCLKGKLADLDKKLSAGIYKVRVVVDLEGNIEIDYKGIEDLDLPVRVRLSPIKINPADLFLYHKSTFRELYDKEREKALKDGFFEVVFLNKNGEFTEGTISNLFFEMQGELYTPPLKCGLLPGVLRQYLLETGKASEKLLHLDDMEKAERILIGNSVRGILETELENRDSLT